MLLSQRNWQFQRKLEQPQNSILESWVVTKNPSSHSCDEHKNTTGIILGAWWLSMTIFFSDLCRAWLALQHLKYFPALLREFIPVTSRTSGMALPSHFYTLDLPTELAPETNTGMIPSSLITLIIINNNNISCYCQHTIFPGLHLQPTTELSSQQES